MPSVIFAFAVVHEPESAPDILMRTCSGLYEDSSLHKMRSPDSRTLTDSPDVVVVNGVAAADREAAARAAAVDLEDEMEEAAAAAPPPAPQVPDLDRGALPAAIRR